MQEMNTFVRDDVMPSWWANRIQQFISTLSSNLLLSLLDATHIQIVAGADDAAAVTSIDGKWRWNEATVTRAHPGGGAGQYDIFVTAAANAIDNSPAPYSDHTAYAFALAIVAHNATPPVVAGVVDIFDKIGECTWDGAAITAIQQTRGRAPAFFVPRSGYASPSNATSRKTLDADAYTPDQLADLLATIIEDVLKPLGLVTA